MSKLNKLFQFRVTESDYNKYMEKVIQSGYTQSEFFREVVIKNKTAIVDKSFSKELIKQLAWIGNNLNQITHALNKDMLMNQYIEIDTLKELKAILYVTRNDMLALKNLSLTKFEDKK